jgi:hypothetical protein
MKKRNRWLLGIGALMLGLTFAPSTQALTPQIATQIVAVAQLAFYRNLPQATYTFDGYLTANPNNSRTEPFRKSITYANGQALYHIPNLTLGTCLLYGLQSWGSMIGILTQGSGPPYGPEQTHGGCTDGSGNAPQSKQQLSSCSAPHTGFAFNNINPMLASAATNNVSGASCNTCGQGRYPCQVGLIGCSNPPAPGSCTPFHF